MKAAHRRWTSPDVVSKMPRLPDNSQICAKWWLRGTCTSNCERASSHSTTLPRTVQPAFDKWVEDCREKFDQAWQPQKKEGTQDKHLAPNRVSQQKNMHFIPDDYDHDPFLLPPVQDNNYSHISHQVSSKSDNLNAQALKLQQKIKSLDYQKKNCPGWTAAQKTIACNRKKTGPNLKQTTERHPSNVYKWSDENAPVEIIRRNRPHTG